MFNWRSKPEVKMTVVDAAEPDRFPPEESVKASPK